MSRSRVDPARRAAYDVLKGVRVDGAYTNLLLPEILRRDGLTGRDAAFVTELASGTIRWQGFYDAVIDTCLTKPKLEAKVRDVLRLGAHQLLGMRVPTHAAISTSVDLARDRIGPGPTGLVNAVLRKVAARERADWVEAVTAGVDDQHARLSIEHSHPRWVVTALAEALHDPDEIAALLAADNEPPAVTLVARPGRSTVEELPGEPTPLSPYGVTSAGGDPGAIPAVAEGRAGVQDEGSQLVALALANAPLNGRDERWLDLCAGPGGKSALLAALAAQRGARLVANEAQEHRAELVRRALSGSDGVESVTTHDGRNPPWEPGSFDRVLVDAPCSGLGALRRRPEARWRKQPSDLDTLVPLQVELLESALTLVRPGGVVVYATCSPVLTETAEVVRQVAAHATISSQAGDLGDGAEGPIPGSVQLWPHRHQTDAMFWTVLYRPGE